MYIEIIVPHGPLVQDVWEFIVVANYHGHIDVRLDDMRRMTRPTARHKFKFDDKSPWWASRRKEYRWDHHKLKQKPAVPQFVQDELLRRINSALMFDYEISD